MSDTNDYGRIPSSDSNNYGNYGTSSSPGNDGAQTNNGYSQSGNQPPTYGTQQGNYGYPNTPQPPSYSRQLGYVDGAEPEKPVAPKTVKIARLLVFIFAGLSLISSIGQLFYPEIYSAGMGESGINEATQQNFETAVMVISGIFQVVIIGLYIFFAIMMAKGANWARIVLTVLMAFGTLSVLSAPVMSFTTSFLESLGIEGTELPLWMIIVSTISGIVSIAFLVYAWRKPSNEFFAKSRARKQWEIFNQYR